MDRPIATFVLSSIVVLAACTGDSNDGRLSGPDSATVPTTAAAPPIAPTTTPGVSTPVVTDPAETTTPTTTTTTTEPAPTTTLDPVVEVEAAVARDFAAADTALLEAFSQPNEARSIGLLEMYNVGPARDVVVSALLALQEEGLAVRPNPNVKQVAVLTSGVEFVDESMNRVAVTTCRVDGAIVFRPGGPGAADDVVVNDTIRRTVARTEFVLTDGTWKLDSGVEISNEVGETSCDEL